MSMSLGKRIRRARESADLTQVQLAARIVPRVTKGAVSNWEKGRDDPTLKNLREIARVCSVKLAWLHNDEESPPLTRNQRKSLEICDVLDDESRADWFSWGNLLAKRATPATTSPAQREN